MGKEGSRFTLLFEQAVTVLVKEMPVMAAARIMNVTDNREPLRFQFQT